MTFSPHYITFPYTKSAPFLLYGVFMTLFLEWTIFIEWDIFGVQRFSWYEALSLLEMDQSQMTA